MIDLNVSQLELFDDTSSRQQVAAEDDGSFHLLGASIEDRRPEGSWTTISAFLLPRVVSNLSDGAAQQV